MLFVSILMLASASVAWFSMNDKATSNNSVINVGQSDGVSYTFYKYDVDLDCVEELQSTDSITLNEYDRIFINENENTPLIIKINNQSAPIVYLQIDRDISDRVVGTNYSSDVLRFTLIVDESISEIIDGTSIYEELNNSYYTTISDSTSDFSNTINSSYICSKTFTNNSQTMVFDLSTINVSNTVFLYVTYDKQSMEQLQVTLDERSFVNDFTMLSVITDGE